jgi:hypothetical protein
MRFGNKKLYRVQIYVPFAAYALLIIIDW